MRDPADVLANQPGLAWHLENLRSYLNVTPEAPASVNWGNAKLTPYGAGAGMRGLPGDVYSPSRFVRAAYLNAHHAPKTGEQANVARVFRTLGGVAMVEGCAEMNDGANELTIFTSAFSAREGRYYYNTYELFPAVGVCGQVLAAVADDQQLLVVVGIEVHAQG